MDRDGFITMDENLEQDKVMADEQGKPFDEVWPSKFIEVDPSFLLNLMHSKFRIIHGNPLSGPIWTEMVKFRLKKCPSPNRQTSIAKNSTENLQSLMGLKAVDVCEHTRLILMVPVSRVTMQFV